MINLTNFESSIELGLGSWQKERVKISSNEPCDLWEKFGKDLDGLRLERIKRSECYDKPRRSGKWGRKLKLDPALPDREILE